MRSATRCHGVGDPLRTPSSAPKHIFTDGLQIQAENINGYLSDAPNVDINRRSTPLSSSLPRMVRGSQPLMAET